MNIETQYLDLLKNILANGERKSNRTGVDCLTIPTVMLQHDMSEGFPLLTTKKMYTKGILVELEGFIKGITDKQWYKDRGCNIWNGWSNPEAVDENDLGPIYGYQWRRFNQRYLDDNSRSTGFLPLYQNRKDQLANIIHTLQNNPNDRRMLCFAWNPLQMDQQALPACHLGFNVQHINGRVHLTWFQRSCDVFLGVPFNIASYAMLLELICAHTGFEAGTLSGVLCDVHIYENHVDQCKEQLGRNPFKLPKVALKEGQDIFQWTHNDVDILGYNSHDTIKAEVAL